MSAKSRNATSMRTLHILLTAVAIGCAAAPARAAEGFAIAGPIGGTDIRSAMLPPPGLYGGLVLVYSRAKNFFDGNGRLVPELGGVRFTNYAAGPFLVYVPDFQLFGGSIGIGGILPGSVICGRVFEEQSEDCSTGLGDAYVEVDWSRFFGTVRPSRYPDAFPIAEGLTISLGFGVLIPNGRYDAGVATTRGLRNGNNIWDFAPTVAFTYVTEPILADGTEVSAKLYWNEYLDNPATDYSSGSLVNVDFAISERVGRFQIGLAGTYGIQVEDDEQFGVPLEPDGRRAEGLSLGGVLAYDMPEFGASIKVKGLATVITHNTTESFGISFGWVKKF
jgi:hypothetical protein